LTRRTGSPCRSPTATRPAALDQVDPLRTSSPPLSPRPSKLATLPVDASEGLERAADQLALPIADGDEARGVGPGGSATDQLATAAEARTDAGRFAHDRRPLERRCRPGHKPTPARPVTLTRTRPAALDQVDPLRTRSPPRPRPARAQTDAGEANDVDQADRVALPIADADEARGVGPGGSATDQLATAAEARTDAGRFAHDRRPLERRCRPGHKPTPARPVTLTRRTGSPCRSPTPTRPAALDQVDPLRTSSPRPPRRGPTPVGSPTIAAPLERRGRPGHKPTPARPVTLTRRTGSPCRSPTATRPAALDQVDPLRTSSPPRSPRPARAQTVAGRHARSAAPIVADAQGLDVDRPRPSPTGSIAADRLDAGGRAGLGPRRGAACRHRVDRRRRPGQPRRSSPMRRASMLTGRGRRQREASPPTDSTPAARTLTRRNAAGPSIRRATRRRRQRGP